MIYFVKCTDSKERQVFPAKIKHKDLIRYHSVRFNSSLAIANIMAGGDENSLKFDDETPIEKRFDETPFNSMMEILRLAFGEKYSVEEIEEFVDVDIVAEVIDIFYGMSSFKKKAAGRTAQTGAS